MRALMNFQERDGWWIHIIAADCRTVLLSFRRVRDQETLLRIVRKLHGDPELAEHDIRRWGRGSVWIDPSPEQRKTLGAFNFV
jgi:hypothetical protein